MGAGFRENSVYSTYTLFLNFVPSYLYIGKNGKNKLYQVGEALQGQTISPKQEAEGITGADLNALVGKQCRVGTANTTKGDKTYSNIDKFLIAKGDFAPLNAKEKDDARIKPKESAEDKQNAEDTYAGNTVSASQNDTVSEDNAEPTN